MMKRKIITRGLAFLMAFAVLFGALPPVLARAELIDISDNEIIISKTVPKGKTGKRMTVNFTVRNNTEEDWQDVEVNIYNGSSYIASPSAEGEYIFPFEVTEGTFEPKHVGTVKKHSSRSVSLPAMVRADLPEGYYAVQIEVSSRDNKATTTEYLNIWITKPTGDDEEEEDDKEVGFVMGEGQPTPRGSYPEAMNFTINMRNNGLSEARDVSVVMVLDKDSTVFPFDINEGNYDRNFEKIEPGQVVDCHTAWESALKPIQDIIPSSLRYGTGRLPLARS